MQLKSNMSFHQSSPIETLDRALLKQADDFEGIGSHIASTEKDERKTVSEL